MESTVRESCRKKHHHQNSRSHFVNSSRWVVYTHHPPTLLLTVTLRVSFSSTLSLSNSLCWFSSYLLERHVSFWFKRENFFSGRTHRFISRKASLSLSLSWSFLNYFTLSLSLLDCLTLKVRTKREWVLIPLLLTAVAGAEGRERERLNIKKGTRGG